MKKRVLCLLLALMMVVGCMPVLSVPAQAAGNGVAQRISQLRSKFPHHAYWNHWITDWSQSGDALLQRGDESYQDSVTQSQCATHNGVSTPGFDCNYFDGGIQCWGFAGKIFYDIFGVRKSQMPKRYDKENIAVGDYVRFGSDGNGHSAVVIDRKGDTLTLVEGNFNNRCMINWDRQINLWQGDPYVGTIAYFCHASNYDTVNGSSPTPTPTTLTLDPPTLIYADETNAQVESYIRNGGNPVYCYKFGMKVWEKATGELIVDHKEDIKNDPSIQGKAFIQIWVNLTRELGVTLKPGTEYEWQYSAITDSGTVNSEKRTYKTKGQAAKPVTIQFLPGDGSGTMKSVTVAAGESYMVPKSDFSAPWGKTFAYWMREKATLGMLPSPCLVGTKLSTSASDAGKTITLTAHWQDNGKYKMKVVEGTEKIVKLTSTNAIFNCDLQVLNPDEETGKLDFKIHLGTLIKIDPDGTKTRYNVSGTQYTPEQLAAGTHTVTLDLSQVKIWKSNTEYHLEPGTKYALLWGFNRNLDAWKGLPVVTLEFTTPAKDGEASPTPTASPTPKPGSDEEPFVSLSVYGDYNESMEYDVWALTYGVDEVHIYVEKDGQVILDRTDSKHFTYTFPGPGTYKIYAVGSSEDGPVSSQPYTVTIPGSAGPGTPTPDPGVPTPTPDPWVPSTPTPKPVQFVDVPQGKYFYSAVIWAVGEGITGGTSATTFSPDKTCTRVQIMTFLWASQGRPTPSSLATFSDMTNNGVFNKAISWAVENKITGGVGDNKFGTNNPCTRVQAVTFLWIAAGKPTPQSTATFSDMPTNPVFRNAISWAVENKITGGVGNNRFGTNRPCTRGQIATFLYAASKLN